MSSLAPKLSSLEENPETINRNQLNNSRAKQQYSFPNSDRFAHSIMSAAPNKYYDLPDLWKPKGKSIGRSNRVDFSKQNMKTPPPGSYETKSTFQKQASEGISMGLGREDVRYRSIFASSSMKSPTATSYRPHVSYNTHSYSISKRLDIDTDKWAREVPGPGMYDRLDLTNNKNQKLISKYRSAQACKFSLDERKGLANKTVAPGPGQYDSSDCFMESSYFSQPYSTKFGSSKRAELAKVGNTPGPGAYTAFSQFLH